jgi:hypothetical protein
MERLLGLRGYFLSREAGYLKGRGQPETSNI